MEHKKTLFTILLFVISAHMYLFAQLKVTEEPTVVAPKPTNTNVQINLKNVVIKKQEIKKVEQPVQEVLKEVIKQELPKTESKNIVKKEKKKKHKEKIVKKIERKPIEKPIEKVAKKEPIKEVFKEKVVEQTITTKAPIQKEEVNPEILKSVENEYLLKVKKLIEENKIYPKSAKRLNQTGKVYLSFTITKDGKVDNVYLSQNCKFERLNNATVEIIERIKKFAPIPNELNKTTWNITVPVVYQIIRS